VAKILCEERVLEYSNEFKIKVVNLTNLEGVQIKQISEGLGLHPFMVSRWRKEVREGKLVSDDTRRILMTLKTPSHLKKHQDDVKALKHENQQLKKENDLLKKWQRYLAEAKKKDSGL
jgi:transposase